MKIDIWIPLWLIHIINFPNPEIFTFALILDDECSVVEINCRRCSGHRKIFYIYDGKQIKEAIMQPILVLNFLPPLTFFYSVYSVSPVCVQRFWDISWFPLLYIHYTNCLDTGAVKSVPVLYWRYHVCQRIRGRSVGA